jgi:hypothetical protein
MPKTADLIWTHYKKGVLSSYYLLVFLGQSDSDLVALIADKIPDSEIAILRSQLKYIRSMDIVTLVEWVKVYMPVAYGNAFFKKPMSRFDFRKIYDLKELPKSRKNGNI